MVNRWLKHALGVDETINYKEEDVQTKINSLCPDGIDIYFDNVGGDILDLALANLPHKAHVVLCGGISRYNASGPVPGPANDFNLIFQRAPMQGFIVIDDAITELKQWLDQGKPKYADNIQQGFKDLPATLIRLFEGKNTGEQ